MLMIRRLPGLLPILLAIVATASVTFITTVAAVAGQSAAAPSMGPSIASFAVTADGAIWHWGRALPPGDLDRSSHKRPALLIPASGSR